MRATDKPFNIDKKLVYEAYKAVKSNGGAAGVDGQTIEQFETDLKRNLYKIWNRMSSGTYFPPPVRAVSIPKKSGGQRILGVPTVADRVAQMVVKQVIEPILDPVFLADSYQVAEKSCKRAIFSVFGLIEAGPFSFIGLLLFLQLTICCLNRSARPTGLAAPAGFAPVPGCRLPR